jgi:hypothetical protein
MAGDFAPASHLDPTLFSSFVNLVQLTMGKFVEMIASAAKQFSIPHVTG